MLGMHMHVYLFLYWVLPSHLQPQSIYSWASPTINFHIGKAYEYIYHATQQ